jgi:hypothetical protein
MKKLTSCIVIAIVALFVSMPASAQFSWGPKIGVAINDLKFNEDAFAASNRAGFTGGLMVELMLPVLNLGFDASLMYVHRSVDYNFKELNENITSNGRDYLEIPINLKWKIGIPVIGKILTPYIFTGPSFSFLVSKKDIEGFLKNKTFDAAWNFGLGVQLFSKLQIGASYGLGMTKAISFIDPDHQNANIEGKNKYWTVTAAWLF